MIPPVLPQMSSGNADLLVTGSAISFQGNPIHFEIGNIKVNLDVKNNPEKSGPYQEGESLDGNTLNLRIYNIPDTGGGTANPLQIGTLLGRLLYLHLRIQTLTGSPDWLVMYSFYLGDRESEGGVQF
jgi:hypothetical protein